MKVALVTHLYDPAKLPTELPAGARFDGSPYAGSFIRESARALASRADVEILVPARYMFSLRSPLKSWKESARLGEVTLDGPVTERLAFWPCRAALCGPPFDAFAVGRQARAIGQLLDSGRRPDVVHAHFAFPAGCATARAVRTRGLPYIITAHDSYLDDVATRFLTKGALRQALAGAARIVVPSCSQRNRVLAWFPSLERKLVVLPNGVDTGLFRPRQATNPTPPARLSFVGNLVAVKNPSLLLDAAERLAEQGFAFELAIAGGGPLRRTLEARAAPFGDRVRFLGSLSREAVAELLRESTDILILPSCRETFGIVLVEALASGVPVVASCCGGPEEIVTDKVGRLVPRGDVSGLANAVREVWNRRIEFSPEYLADYARERFGSDSVAERVATLYGEVLRERG